MQVHLYFSGDALCVFVLTLDILWSAGGAEMEIVGSSGGITHLLPLIFPRRTVD